MLIDITNFNFECGDKGGSVLIDFNFACDCNNNGGTETYNLELNLKDFGYGYGSFKLNETTYSPTKTPYKLNFTDELTSFSLSNSNVEEIISFPNTSKVKSLNSVFSYSPITYLDLRDWDLSSIEDVDFAFSYMQNCKSINFNTDILKGKTSAQGLFGGCYVLETVNGNDVTFGASTSGITNASYMFYGCKKITDVNLSANNVKNASHMFDGCSSLTKIAGGVWNGVTDASYMFSRCSSLDMNYFNTNSVFWQDLISSNCTNISGMFNGCNFGNSSINFPSSWKVNYVTDMSYLFSNSNLGDFSRPSNWDWLRCSNFSHMFEGNTMNNISFYGADWANATDFSYMFKDCLNLNTVDFGDAYNLTGVTNVEGMFEGCTNLQAVFCSDCDTYNIIKRGLESSGLDSSIIQGCDCGDSGDSYGYSVLSFIMDDYVGFSYSINGYSKSFSSSGENELYSASTQDMKSMVGGSITSLSFYGGIKQFVAIPQINTLNELSFDNLGVDFIDLSKTNLNNLTSFSLTSCSNLKHIDLSNWTSFTVNSYSFNQFNNLKSVKMLNCCEEAKQFIRDRLSENGINAIVITEENNTYLSLDYISTPISYYINGIEYSTVSNVTDLSSQMNDGNCSVHGMFGNVSNIKTVYTMPSLRVTSGHWDMFNGCSGLLYQDLSTWNFDFNNGDQDINTFFSGNSSLVWVNFSGWDLTNAYNAVSMFTSCEKLKYVFAYGCNESTISKLQQGIDNSGYSINLVH